MTAPLQEISLGNPWSDEFLVLADQFDTKIGTILLIIFMLPVTFIFHNFWTLPTETELEIMTQQTEMVSFLKNITIIGALFLIFSNEKE